MKVAQCIKKGLSDRKESIPDEVKPCCSDRKELIIISGIVLKGEIVMRKKC